MLEGTSPARPLVVSMPMLTLVTGGMGGTETYARELVQALEARDDVLVRPFVSVSAAGFTRHPGEQVVDDVTGGPSTTQRLRAVVSSLRPSLGRRVSDGADVVHYPFTIPVPRSPRPSVLTLHDVQHRDMPEFFSPPERAFRRLSYDRAARRADHVITDSEFCRQRIIDTLGLPPERVTVAHLGVAADFEPARSGREPFVLYPARRWPHKNHRRLVEAMCLVRARQPDLRLVLTGGGDDLPNVPSWVEQRGLVTREELLQLYRSAACLAFPSLYEGFGLPPLEALASGCPVAVSSAGSLPEVVGDAGVVFDALEPQSIAAGIEEALASGERRVDAGLVQARRFTWQACAEMHVRVYRGLVR